MGVGKSSLMQMFTLNKFSSDIAHTIGVEFGTKVIEIKGEKIKLQIWDTAGQERFRAVTRSYYRGAAGIVLVYDISRRSTFIAIENWLQDARNLTTPNVVIFLIGNKMDLEDSREVTTDEGAKFAQDNGILFAECSAKNGSMVEESFLQTAQKVYEGVLQGSLHTNSSENGVQKKPGVNADIDLKSADNKSTSSSCAC
ncbi:Ras- protein Rab-14 [Cichlidogyrus casuarinus]|uniref:Ras- protein Rab-14 n=1 Tax=Cichlidogyrus casuarinus TaxID=1844966 RepID=A0ABD2PYI4_9PLAT